MSIKKTPIRAEYLANRDCDWGAPKRAAAVDTDTGRIEKTRIRGESAAQRDISWGAPRKHAQQAG